MLLRLPLALPSVHPLFFLFFPLFLAFLLFPASAGFLLRLAAGNRSHMRVHLTGVGIAGAVEAGLHIVQRLSPQRWAATSQTLTASRRRLDVGLLRVAAGQISEAPEPFKTCGGLRV